MSDSDQEKMAVKPIYAVLFATAGEADAPSLPFATERYGVGAGVTAPHGFDRDMAAALPGMWYCLHLPKTLFDLVDVPAAATFISCSPRPFRRQCDGVISPQTPPQGPQPPRPRRGELAILDEAATRRLLEAVAGTRLEGPVAIAIATGMRRGEILAFRCSDIEAGYTIAHVRRSMSNGNRFDDC